MSVPEELIGSRICNMADGSEIERQWPALPRAAHELNKDLGIIAAECDLLSLLLKGNPSALARVDSIRETAKRMADRITNYA